MIKRTVYCYERLQYTDVDHFIEEDETGRTLKWRSNDDGTTVEYGWVGPTVKFVAAGSGPVQYSING